MEKTKILFFISDESDNFKDSIIEIKKLIKKGCDLTVISLSILTSINLKKHEIEYKTPKYYSDEFNPAKLDKTALKFAQNWYNYFKNEIIYKDISLGEMLEYDFFFLFVDALRNFEIAKKMLSSEHPDIIYLPQNMKLNDPNFLCYETLPKIIPYLANNKIIKVISPNNTKYVFDKNSFSLSKIRDYLFNNIFYFYTKIVNLYQMYFLCHMHHKVVLFWNVYAFKEISRNINNKGYHSTRIYPSKVNNKFSKNKIEKIKDLNIKLKKKGYSDIKLYYNDFNIALILRYRFEEAFIKFQELVQFLEWSEQIECKFQQSMIVSMEDITPVKRSVIKWFKINKIPSLIIQHGFVSKDMAGFGAMPIEANKQAVWGDNSYEWHLKRRKKSQVITGNPVFDQISEYKDHFKKKETFIKLGLDPTKKIILITTERFAGITSGHTIEDEEKLIRNTIRSLKDFNEEQKIIKLHPGHQEKYEKIVSNIANEEKIDLFIFKDYYWDLIMLSDVLITFASTTGVESMLFGKPTIAIGTKDEIESYTSSISAIGVYDWKELAPIIKKILDGKLKKYQLNSLESFIYKSNYLNDNKSSERIAELILKQLLKK